MSKEVTHDGYRIIPERPVETSKGWQCGKCGMRAKWDEPLGYYCPHTECPVFVKATC